MTKVERQASIQVCYAKRRPDLLAYAPKANVYPDPAACNEAEDAARVNIQ